MNARLHRAAERLGALRPVHWAFALLAFYLYAAIVAAALLAYGEWSRPTWRERIQVHGRSMDVPVPLAIRLATTPAGVRWLDGRAYATRYGRLEFAREPGTERLRVTCAPCRFDVPALGTRPVELRHATVAIARVDRHLAGDVHADGLAIGWHGELTDAGLRLHFALPETPLATALQPFAAALPELAYARIGGTVALHGEIDAPAGGVRLEPTLRGLSVAGLGTERLVRPIAIAGCTTRPKIGGGAAWRRLGAAVVAAEDQRFYEHPGYDLDEIRSALDRNADEGRATRGASTLTQQLARIVYTGAERNFARKLRELLYAADLERTQGKARILDLYLAMAPWGSGGCGAQAAARNLYARPLERLTVAETARLAAGLRDDERWRDDGAAARIVRGMRSITRTERSAAIAELCAGSIAPECVARQLHAAR